MRTPKARRLMTVFWITIPGFVYTGANVGGILYGRLWLGISIGLIAGLAAGAASVYWARRNDVAGVANAVLFGGGVVAAALFGAALIGQMYASHLFAASPPASFDIIQSPKGDGLFLFFILFNPLMELLFIPATLILNWHNRTRRAIIAVGAVVYYAMRVWTYVYFVPIITDFASMPTSGPFSPELAEQAREWVSLSWYRMAADGIVFGCFFLAAFIPFWSRGRTPYVI